VSREQVSLDSAAGGAVASVNLTPDFSLSFGTCAAFVSEMFLTPLFEASCKSVESVHDASILFCSCRLFSYFLLSGLAVSVLWVRLLHVSNPVSPYSSRISFHAVLLCSVPAECVSFFLGRVCVDLSCPYLAVRNTGPVWSIRLGMQGKFFWRLSAKGVV